MRSSVHSASSPSASACRKNSTYDSPELSGATAAAGTWMPIETRITSRLRRRLGPEGLRAEAAVARFQEGLQAAALHRRDQVGALRVVRGVGHARERDVHQHAGP